MRNVVGVSIVCNNDMINTEKGKIPIRIPQYIEYIKRMVKGAAIITTLKSYPELLRVLGIKDYIVVTEQNNPELPSNIKTFKSFEEAIEYADKTFPVKNDIVIMVGHTAAKYLLDKKIYTEYLKIRIDLDYDNGDKLGIDFGRYPQTNTAEEFYYSGFSFWYEKYDMRHLLSRRKDPVIEFKDFEDLVE